MKKILWIALLSILLTAALSAAAAENTKPAAKLTVMLYMVGSDLESDSGAATQDLEEMRTAGLRDGVCLTACIGGAESWQTVGLNDGGILWLNGDEWASIQSPGPENMGDPAALSEFLNYAQEKFPAEHYALILWDHGQGPIVGYGGDRLNDNDRLTLSELTQALSKSPFAAEPLAWLGFDACLMASAETASVLSGYADYMIASQDMEPQSGWNYAFLSELEGDEDGAEAAKAVAASYETFYEALYRDFPDYMPQLTLSCVDLGRIGDVEAALDAMALEMSQALASNRYSGIVNRRVQTQAFGRSEEGLNYDLIDLRDLASQFSGVFPQSSQALLQAVDECVPVNLASRENAGGLSVYYPYYNKQSYNAEWREVYHELGFSENYLEFLDAYAEIWQSAALAEWKNLQTTPLGDGYALQLTPEQAENFASARFLILRNVQGSEYYAVYGSDQVSITENGQLRADFEDRIVCSYDGEEYVAIPATLISREGDYSIYEVICTMGYRVERAGLKARELSQGVDITLRFHEGEEKGEILSITPHASDGELPEGKREYSLEDASYLNFCRYARFKTYADDGELAVYADWEYGNYIAGCYVSEETYKPIDLRFMLADIANAEESLYFMFELKDTQGNIYASEPVPMISEPEPTETEAPPPEAAPVHRIDLTQANADAPVLSMGALEIGFSEVEIVESFRLDAYLSCTNRSEEALKLSVENGSVNGVLHTGSLDDALAPYEYEHWLQPGETRLLEYALSTDSLRTLRLANLETIGFTLVAENDAGERVLEEAVELRLDFSMPGADKPMPDWSMGMEIAEPCMLMDTNGVKAELLGAVRSLKDGLTLYLSIANGLDVPIKVSVDLPSADGTMLQHFILYDVDGYHDVLPAGMREIEYLNISVEELSRCGLESVGELEFTLTVRDPDSYAEKWQSPVQIHLNTSAQAESSPPVTLLENEDICIQAQRADALTFRLIVENRGECGLRLSVRECAINDVSCDTFCFLSGTDTIPAGKRAVLDTEITAEQLIAAGQNRLDSVSMRLVLIDTDQDALISTVENFTMDMRG